MNKMTSEHLEETGYVHDLESPIKSHPSRVLQPTKSEVQSLKWPFNIVEACLHLHEWNYLIK